MAVTKKHPIKINLKTAVDYILNSEKKEREVVWASFWWGGGNGGNLF